MCCRLDLDYLSNSGPYRYPSQYWLTRPYLPVNFEPEEGDLAENPRAYVSTNSIHLAADFWPDEDISIEDTASHVPPISNISCLEIMRTLDATYALVLRKVEDSDRYQRIGCMQRKEHPNTSIAFTRLSKGGIVKSPPKGYDNWFIGGEEKANTIV
jgi:hypothetical protein